MINCDWNINTSRENISDDSWNRNIRDGLSKFFVWISINDKFIKQNIGHFTNQNLHNEWWNLYYYSIIDLLVGNLFLNENGKVVKFANERIEEIVKSSIIEQYTNVIIKDPIKVSI